MKPIKNIYEQISSYENIYQAFLSARKGKRFRGDVMEFTMRLEDNIIAIQNELIYETYTVSRYNEFFISEPKRRLIMALPFKDRVVQWAIYRVLNPLMSKSYITHTYACVVGRGAHGAVNQLNYWLRLIGKKPGKWYYLKIDISKFFYRVDHDILLGMFKRKFDDERLINLLERIIRSEKNFGLPPGCEVDEVNELIPNRGMPIGNLTSQMFANIYLDALDQYCKRHLQIKYYIRYMDDIIILNSTKEEAHLNLQYITSFLNMELLLDVNRKTAIRPITLGIEFVGYKVHGTHIKLRKSTALKVKRKFTLMQKLYAVGKIDLEKIKRVKASYFGIMQHCDSYNFRKQISKKFILKQNRE
jgi:retron-type reverse transcriptase